MSLNCYMCSSSFDDVVSYEVHCLYAHISNNFPFAYDYNGTNALVSQTNDDGNYSSTSDTNSESTAAPVTDASSFDQTVGSDPSKQCNERTYNLTSEHLGQQSYQYQPTQSHLCQHQSTYFEYACSSLKKYDKHVSEKNSGGYTDRIREYPNGNPVSNNADMSKYQLNVSQHLPTTPSFHNDSLHAFHPVSQSVRELNSFKALYNLPLKDDRNPKTNHQLPIAQEQKHPDLTIGDGSDEMKISKESVDDKSSLAFDFNSVSTTQMSPSDNRSTNKSPSKVSKNSKSSWKSNAVRRPKTYYCPACKKWFTSSGHLTRHYKTALHKNSVKVSGAPDPALLPVRVHYYPHKDPEYSTSHQQIKVSPSPAIHVTEISDHAMNSGDVQSINSTAASNLYPHFPNLMAGPAEVSGSLLNYPSYKLPPDFRAPSPITSLQQQQQHQSAGFLQYSNHTSYSHGFSTLAMPQSTMPQFFQQPTQTTLYPNFKAPYMSNGNHQVTLNNTFCDLMAVKDEPNSASTCSKGVDSSKLPAFADIQRIKSNDSAMGIRGEEQFPANASEYGTVKRTSFVLSKDELDKSANIGNIESINNFSQLWTVQPLFRPTNEDTNVTSSTGSLSENTNNIFRCRKCNKDFNQERYLTRHDRMFHGILKPFKCLKCGKCFKEQKKYRQHMKKHARGGVYKCDQCSKTFVHKTNLKRHVCVRRNLRMYTCDKCGKGFIRKNDMTKHSEIHRKRRRSQRLKNMMKERKISLWD